jgi:hypothetical protein
MPVEEPLPLDETLWRIWAFLHDWPWRRYPEPVTLRSRDRECPDYECPSVQEE